MSERRTDSSIAYDWRLVQNKTDATEQMSMAQTRLEEELKRARASEDQKDATIKALAEVLNKCRTQARGTKLEDEINAALRLAGRL